MSSAATMPPQQPPNTHTIPTIDLSLPTPLLTSQLHSACTTCGFFYLVHHGVPASLQSRVFDSSRRFFDLPSSTKQHYLTNRHNRGYTADDEQPDESSRHSRPDSKESFYWSKHRQPDNERPLWGPNVRVSEDDVAGFNDSLDEYMSAVAAVGLRLTELLYVALHRGRDDDGNWARKAGCFDDPTVVLRLLRYDERLSSETDGQLACGAHCDWGMLTLLATDDQPGLQIWLRDDESRQTDTQSGQWLPVPPLPGAFIVNLGDMLMRWTNGQYRSTLHRVLNTTGRPRYSMPVFYEPNFDCVVECLPSCVDERHPLMFKKAVTAGRYLADRYAVTQDRFRHSSQQQIATSE